MLLLAALIVTRLLHAFVFGVGGELVLDGSAAGRPGRGRRRWWRAVAR
ncbi:hypothetical protein [Streptomyces cyanogenus]|nr:hypothetical protein [Streptomyces cyanogenus]